MSSIEVRDAGIIEDHDVGAEADAISRDPGHVDHRQTLEALVELGQAGLD